ncbi:MAG: hypothetical protein M1837_001371 [Sclerophora amabilis]|nr:MAG: hypothetical protein M1837_001371 [Sclerophora amabilis]
MSKNASQQSRSSSLPNPAAFHFLAGLFSGVSSAILLQPADLLKTRVQQSRSSSLLQTLLSISRGPSPLRQLWRGTIPSTLRTGFGSALYFSSLNALRESVARTQVLRATTNALLTNPTPHEASPTLISTSSLPPPSSSSSSSLPRLSNLANLATGALARGTVGFVMMPITVLKVRYESNYYTYRSLWGAGRQILHQEGLRGFFSGFGATALRDAPYAGMYVLFYEQSKRRLGDLFAPPRSTLSSTSPVPSGLSTTITTTTTPNDGNGTGMAGMAATSLSVPINFTSGALAATLATALTNPFDAVKTRLQLFPHRYDNMLRTARTMVRDEGWRSLVDGLGLRMARKAVSSALAWTVYEELVRRGERRWRRRLGES